MAKQFVVIGLGRFGASVAKTLYSLGHDVLAIDDDERLVQEIADKVTHAVHLDATDEQALNSLGIRNFDVGVVSIGSDIQASIMVTMLLKEAGILHIVCKAQSELHRKVLLKLGADRVILPEKDMGERVAHNLASPNLLDSIDLSDEHQIIEIKAPARWVGKSIQELRIREKYGVNILALRLSSGKLDLLPDPDIKLSEGSIIVAIAENREFKRLERLVLTDEN